MKPGVFSQILRRANRKLQHHHCDDHPSRSWRFAQVTSEGGRLSAYSFLVTWSPGVLTVTGDLEDLIVTHYHAMTTIAKAARWVAAGDFQYLMGKSSAKKEYDREATAAFIIEMANDEARAVLRECLKEARRYRRDYRADDDPDGEVPDPDDYEMQPVIRRLKHRDHHPEHLFVDGFTLWSRLCWELEAEHHPRPDSATRREFKERLAEHLNNEGPETAGELCQNLGIDDYYGTFEYTIHNVWQYAALKMWAAHVLAEQSAVAA